MRPHPNLDFRTLTVVIQHPSREKRVLRRTVGHLKQNLLQLSDASLQTNETETVVV